MSPGPGFRISNPVPWSSMYGSSSEKLLKEEDEDDKDDELIDIDSESKWERGSGSE